jgi:hypothetical protein
MRSSFSIPQFHEVPIPQHLKDGILTRESTAQDDVNLFDGIFRKNKIYSVAEKEDFSKKEKMKWIK